MFPLPKWNTVLEALKIDPRKVHKQVDQAFKEIDALLKLRPEVYGLFMRPEVVRALVAAEEKAIECMAAMSKFSDRLGCFVEFLRSKNSEVTTFPFTIPIAHAISQAAKKASSEEDLTNFVNLLIDYSDRVDLFYDEDSLCYVVDVFFAKNPSAAVSLIASFEWLRERGFLSDGTRRAVSSAPDGDYVAAALEIIQADGAIPLRPLIRGE